MSEKMKNVANVSEEVVETSAKAVENSSEEVEVVETFLTVSKKPYVSKATGKHLNLFLVKGAIRGKEMTAYLKNNDKNYELINSIFGDEETARLKVVENKMVDDAGNLQKYSAFVLYVYDEELNINIETKIMAQTPTDKAMIENFWKIKQAQLRK